jgi:hypothetical protein
VDRFEVGPEGLARHGIFGVARYAWDEIAEFKIRALPTSTVPIAWMSLRLNTNEVRRFYLTGYIRIKLFAGLGEQAGEVSDWFSQLKSAYTKGNAMGVLPSAPWAFIGKISDDMPASGQVASTSVIER